jgi:hypothetical protein
VGPLELHYEKLLVPGAPGQTLVTYHASPGSDSEERLRLLASLNGTARSSANAARSTADS